MAAEKTLLEALHKAHAEILSELQGLEEKADASAGTSGEELSQRLRTLRAEVAGHFVLEEQDGYLDPVLSREAGAHRKAMELLGEHSSLLQSLDVLIQRAAAEGSRSTTLWESVKHWMDQLREHEARENEFFDEVQDDDFCCRRD